LQLNGELCCDIKATQFGMLLSCRENSNSPVNETLKIPHHGVCRFRRFEGRAIHEVHIIYAKVDNI